jgi:tight adherence protein B
MLLLISATAFLALMTMLLFLTQAFSGDKQAVKRRISRYVDKENTVLAGEYGAVSGNNSKGLSGWRLLLRGMSRYFEFPRWSKKMEHKLIQAGIPMRGSEFTALCVIVGAGLALWMFVVTAGSVVGTLAGGGIGFAMPFIVLRIKTDKRTKAFNSQLGDALILAANSLRTGYSFMQALEMVSREMPKPISEEFGRVLKEINLGVTMEDAMNNLAKRVNSEDLELVITAVLIQRQVGGNLSEVLDNIAGTIRERVRIKGHIRTLTAQGRISGIIVGLLPVGIGIMIYFMNPSYIKLLFVNPLGKVMLMAGVVSQIIGVLVIRRIVDIDV